MYFSIFANNIKNMQPCLYLPNVLWAISSIFLILTLQGCKNKNNTQTSIQYPITEKVKQIDTYFGKTVEDEYRWLENDKDPKVSEWIKAQNKVTFEYLEKIPYRNAIKQKIEKLINFEKFSIPIKVGEYYLFYRNKGLQNQSVIYIQKGVSSPAEIFIDPNEIDKNGTTAIRLLSASPDNKYIAYSQSVAGSDWSEIYIMEIATKKKLPDVLKWAKFTDVAWKDNSTFFYSRYPEPEKGKELSGQNQFHSIYEHKIGDTQDKDKLIYRNNENPLLYHSARVTEDKKYLIMTVASGTNGFETYYKDLTNPFSKFQALFTGFEYKSSVIEHINGKFLVRTDIDAPKYKLVLIDPKTPQKEKWQTIIPEKEHLLEEVTVCGGKIFAKYLENASNKIYQMDLDGKNTKEIKLPSLGTVDGFNGKKEDKITFYSFTSFTYPSAIYKYDIETGESVLHFNPNLSFNPDDYETKQIFATSKDGTKVPIFVVHKKGLVLNGKHPTLLYSYGGFNVNLTPSFSASRIILLENDGVFAMANLRGGGEFGEEWHKAGMRLNKQNVFNDFIAAAEYLIAQKYTNSEKLAIAGGSNGGLLVGACITQRPELYKVAFPAVGVMDMLRYHKFTVGWGWIPEYGCADSSETDFKNLYAYSPLHNIKEANYPATLVTTADHDDRVVPAHSFKFIAKLQAHQKGQNPTLIRIETNAGHGAGKSTSKIIDEESDKWAFMFYNMGIQPKL
ncbi:MAG: prolyl oligopeptidase family serine peptidase [Bacteroidia bacterium]|nr:prolyl oligopeptidase family serine peptidase [Bacteroidia bacterium]MDW8345779.1 prolyl oligopeptidase family serine peptidase [Bacteroidia bacterium]